MSTRSAPSSNHMTRRTARVFERFLDAWDLNEVLKAAHVDSKIVTKHAVQFDPRQEAQAKAAVEHEKKRRQANA